MIRAGVELAGRFELRRRIGAGGMGEVFEALDRDSNELVALKTLVRADGETVVRFKREFRALQSIAHPNLVSLRDLVRDGDRWFFTMELVRGLHFLEHVRGDQHRLRASLRGLATGLRVLHGSGLVHRDIKPSNVMVTEAGRVVLLDFGLVTTLDPTQQSTAGHAIGTVEYMAPEQAVGHKVTEAADWYAVGVMLYEALTGQVPHNGYPLQILVSKQEVEARPAEELAPDAPADLVALCKDLLRIEPAQRPDGATVARRLGAAEPDRGRSTTTSIGSSRGVFVGRDRELAELAASYQQARERPIVHLVVGESGIGKSELVARMAATVQEADPQALIFGGRCYERETVPYKALDGIADGLAQYLAQEDKTTVDALLPARPALLVRIFPVFHRVAAIAMAPVGRDEGADPQEQRRRMIGALRALLTAIAGRRRVVFTIDDLQWADADSFLLLRELLRGAGAPRALVLATVRHVEGDSAVPVEVMAERLGSVTVHRTVLGPLTGDESRVLAEQLVPDVASRLDLARIAREAGGHPMFLQEILRHLDGAGTGAPSATLDDALWARVSLLGPDARALLEPVCVAGAPISPEIASAACRLDSTTLARATASLRVASLVREVQRGRGRSLALEPYHDRVREAVQGRLSEAQRSDVHARLATALEQSGEPRDPQQLLRHFRLAGMPARAARYAEEAAQRSLDAHAFDQAAELWHLALELTERTDDDRRRLQLRLGEALVAAGRGGDAADAYTAAAEGADRPTRLECHRHVAEQLLISGRIDRGVTALQTLLAEIGVKAPATPRGALLSLIRHRLWLRLRGLRYVPRHRKEVADADILRLDALGVAATGLSVVDTIRGADFQTRQLLLALRSGHRPHIARALIIEGTYQATHGHTARSAVMFARAQAIEGFADDPALVGVLAGARGFAAYFAGDAPRAFELLNQGIAIAREIPGANWELSSMKVLILFALRFIGDYALMRRYYDQYAAEAQQRGDLYIDSTTRRVCVPMWLAEDNPAEAARELERATWVPERGGFHVQHFHEMIGRGEIALYTGEPADRVRLADAFARLKGSLLLRVASVRNQDTYLRGRLAVVAGDLRATARCARTLGKEQGPIARVCSLLLLAACAAAAGHRDRAIGLLGDADAAARAGGLKLLGAAARRRGAELSGDEALAAAADADMNGLGVRAPPRMTALLIPRAAAPG